MVPVGAVLIVLIIFGAISSVILGSVYFVKKNKERMAILTHNADANIFQSDHRSTRNFALKMGILFIFIATGIIFGYILSWYYIVPDAVAYFASIFMCGGLGLVIGAVAIKNPKEN